jgi:hypothetical protein
MNGTDVLVAAGGPVYACLWLQYARRRYASDFARFVRDPRDSVQKCSLSHSTDSGKSHLRCSRPADYSYKFTCKSCGGRSKGYACKRTGNWACGSCGNKSYTVTYAEVPPKAIYENSASLKRSLAEGFFWWAAWPWQGIRAYVRGGAKALPSASAYDAERIAALLAENAELDKLLGEAKND